jgi:hypothetical protein
MFFTLKSSILVISGYLRTVQVAPGHPVMPCESLGKSLQTCLSQDKSGFPDVGACDSWQLGSIERESGEYIEKAFLGAITCAEFELEPMCLMGIGIKKDERFYPIGES